MITITEYRVNVLNPVTKEILASQNLPLYKLDNYDYNGKEAYLIGIALEMIRDDSLVRNCDFDDITVYLEQLAGEEFGTVEEIYDYIDGMPSVTCFVSDSVNPYTESKSENPVIMITTVSYEDENGVNAEEKPIGFAGQYYDSNDQCITVCIFKTYAEASDCDEFDRIVPVYFGKPLI